MGAKIERNTRVLLGLIVSHKRAGKRKGLLLVEKNDLATQGCVVTRIE